MYRSADDFTTAELDLVREVWAQPGLVGGVNHAGYLQVPACAANLDSWGVLAAGLKQAGKSHMLAVAGLEVSRVIRGWYEGCSLEEIGESLDLDPGTISRHLSHGTFTPATVSLAMHQRGPAADGPPGYTAGALRRVAQAGGIRRCCALFLRAGVVPSCTPALEPWQLALLREVGEAAADWRAASKGGPAESALAAAAVAAARSVPEADRHPPADLDALRRLAVDPASAVRECRGWHRDTGCQTAFIWMVNAFEDELFGTNDQLE